MGKPDPAGPPPWATSPPTLGARSSSGSAIKPTASIAQTHTALGDGSTRRLRRISVLSAMSPMRTGSLAQAGNSVPYAHPHTQIASWARAVRQDDPRDSLCAHP